jgi:16S rRNA (uracil1498-N3)-methyltransferase
MSAGAPLTLFNGDGADYDGVIARATTDAVSVRIAAARPALRESPLEITLAQGVSRGERMDYTVQKATELGVTRVEPVTTSRGVVRLDAARARQKTEHWQAVIVSACEQCGRNRVPPVGPVTPFPQWLARGRGDSVGILLEPESGRRLADLPRPSGGLTLLAGPEGGLTDEERQAALRSGFVAVRLGPRVLRTETAALAALAAMQVLWGDF